MNKGFIYLIRPNFMNNVVKIGRTKNLVTRLYPYTKGSKVIFSSISLDYKRHEQIIKDLFRQKYISRRDIGTEYFQGNEIDEIKMIIDICDIINLKALLNTQNKPFMD